MEITFTEDSKKFTADLNKPIDISIEISFQEKQLSAFDGPPASKHPYLAGSFIGNVSNGGSCNCDVVSFSPHLNGTHTECVGHITATEIYLNQVIKNTFMMAAIISVKPAVNEDEFIITHDLLHIELKKLPYTPKALIIRTMPNNEEKKVQHYSNKNAAYFNAEAMKLIVGNNIEHLLVDLPSIDKMDDGGKLLNHRIFWALGQGDASTDKPSHKTITELVFVPNAIQDGLYLLNLQVPAMNLDAVPSRPVLYEVNIND